MTRYSKFLNTPANQGQSIVQVLVSIGLLGVMAVIFAGISSNQSREIHALSEQLAKHDAEKLLISSLADGTVCSYVMNNPTVLTFDSTNLPQTIPLTNPSAATAALYSAIVSNPGPPPTITPGPIVAQVGAAPSALATSLVIQSISLVVSAGTAGQYVGHWQVNYDPSLLVRSLKGSQITTKITADITVPTAAKITSCQAGGGGGTPVCHIAFVEGPAPSYVSDVKCGAGEYLMAGGGLCEQPGYPLCGGVSSGRLHYSAPDSDMMGWSVDCWDDLNNREACSRAYAICCNTK